eukprot:GHVO01043829.1.p1 GENE.GHVO01043829.1~~GHVO01043829.1.p1  ORF type:complete len:385 (-),score=66.51 GHVO01043829.1:142-1296(-)
MFVFVNPNIPIPTSMAPIHDVLRAALGKSVEMGSADARERALEVLAVVKEDPLCARALLEELKKTLLSQQWRIQSLSLDIVELLMAKGSLSLQQKILERDFLAVLERVLKRPHTSPDVQGSVLRLFGTWSNQFSAHESDIVPHFQVMRRRLKEQGYSIGGPDLDAMDAIYDESFDRGIEPELRKRLDDLKSIVKNASEAIDSCPDVPSLILNALVKQSVAVLRREAKKLQTDISHELSGDSLSALIETNDLILEALEKHARRLGGEPPPKVEASSSSADDDPSSEVSSSYESDETSESESEESEEPPPKSKRAQKAHTATDLFSFPPSPQWAEIPRNQTSVPQTRTTARDVRSGAAMGQGAIPQRSQRQRHNPNSSQHYPRYPG